MRSAETSLSRTKRFYLPQNIKGIVKRIQDGQDVL
jgi:hypothetical protein